MTDAAHPKRPSGDGRRGLDAEVGVLASITRYAVKSLGGEALESVEVRIDGLPHDRHYAVVGAEGFYLTHEDFPVLSRCHAAVRGGRLRVTVPDGRVHDLGDALDHELSRLTGQPVRLREVDLGTTHGPDALPSLAQHLGLPEGSPLIDPNTASHVHVLSDVAMATLSRAHPTDSLRFRSTFSITLMDSLPGVPENNWMYRDLSIGEVAVTIYGPAVNCCTQHSTGGLHTNTYGVHALVRRPGRARVGDPVRLGPGAGQERGR